MKTIAGLRFSVMIMGVLASAVASAQTTVGRTAGQASATPTGAARYAIPLTLPPGTNGLVPSLAITYDSRSGNGLLGVGFRMTGLSSITRCARNFAQDAAPGAVALRASDPYCLDGQRLRLVAGSHGQAGAQYQTEVERFARVTAVGAAGSGPASFRVEQRDGLIYEYGGTADARIESTSSDTPRAWALSRIRDRSGNYIDFVYEEDAAAGSHRPLRIDYTGNVGTGMLPFYSVRFLYESRPAGDIPAGYFAGGLLSETTRLDRVDIQHVSSGRVLRRFELSYDALAPTGRSRLATVQECAGTTCLPATVFGWTNVATGWILNMSAAIPVNQYPSALPGDIDGDGFDDLTYRDPASRSWRVLRGTPFGFQGAAIDTGLGADSDPTRAMGADLDGDGHRDVLVLGSGNYWHWLRRTRTGTYAYSSTGVIDPAAPGGLLPADIDGDGRDDLVYVKAAGGAIYWRRSLTGTAAGFAAEAVLWTAPSDTKLHATPFLEPTQRYRSMLRNGDFNGDGRTDLVVRVSQVACATPSTCGLWTDRWQVLASSGSALVSQYSLPGGYDLLLTDANADGLTDLAYWTQGSSWQLIFSTGSRGSQLANLTLPVATEAAAPASGGGAVVFDWDSDGRMDLLQPGPDGDMQYCRSTGTSFEACRPGGLGAGIRPTAPMMLDVNGDGFPDITYAASTVRLHLHQQVPPDHLVSARDGLGAESRFEYAAMSSPAVHQPGTQSVFPVRDLARGGFVVSRITRIGERGPVTETLTYAGAKMHAQGRGFLGFASRKVAPSNGAMVRVEEFHQDPAAFERIGAPSRITLQQASSSPVLRTTYVWDRQVYGTGFEARRFAYPASILAERFELDGVRVSSTTTTNTFDAHGSPVQRRVVTREYAKGLNPGAEHVETTTLSGVVNDTSNWCLGKPATTQVTRYHTLPGGAALTRSDGRSWDLVHCRLTQHVVEPMSPTLRVTTDLVYDDYGNLVRSTVTPVGEPARVSAVEWTNDGRFMRSTTNPLGHKDSIDWDPITARATRVTDPNGLSRSRQFDSLDRLVRETRPDGTSTAVSLGGCGPNCSPEDSPFVITVSERGAGDVPISSAETRLDRYGRTIYASQEQPGGAMSFTQRSYGPRGDVASETIPALCCAAPVRWVRYAHDALGRPISVERPGSESVPTPVVVRWRHDGLTLDETDALGRTTVRRHDAVGNVLQVVDPAASDTDYEYDAFGNLTRTQDFQGSVTSVTYDARGRRTSLADPDSGIWTFEHSPLGELKSQVNPRGEVARHTYDLLSRPLSRVETEGTTAWTWGTSAASRNLGLLASVSSPGFREKYQYDSLGRPSVVTTTIAGKNLVTRYGYDAMSGLLDRLTYPVSTGTGPLRVRHHYDRGRLVRLSDADSGALYWQLDSADAYGLPTEETLGNGVRVASVYDAVTARLVARTAGPGGGDAHQSMAFEWDDAGNLVFREDRNSGLREQFAYDLLDRLDFVQRDGNVTLDLSYDAVGNLTYKSDVGDYRYDLNRRHAAVAAGANSYAYDANGAVVNANGTAITWFSHDLPSRITHPGGNYSAFYYGADRARYRQTARAGGVLTDTLYATGGLYERATTGSITRHRHYIVADGRRVAVHTRQSGSNPSTVYLLEDHLGGVAGASDAAGGLLLRHSYAPFGARRSGDGLAAAPTAAEWQAIQSTTARGFTDHEHLDNLGIVHMNGRIYDPGLGRFLSPDPVVQSPYDTQGQNPYAYVRNNPLRYTDPSGFCFNTHPAADHLIGNCLEQIVVQAIQGSVEFGWLESAAQAIGLNGAVANAGDVADLDGLLAQLENVTVTAQRPQQGFAVPLDIQAYAAFNLLQASLIDRMMRASTELGDEAVYHWINQAEDTGNPLYHIPGHFAALWVPETAWKTSLALSVAGGLGSWSARPYWQYFPSGNRAYQSSWLTRSAGWRPPFQTGREAASALSLPPYNPGTAVRLFEPKWFEFVRGPRVVGPQPRFGEHAVGGGLEYRMVPFGE